MSVKQNLRQRQHGVTLIEVLVAMVIIAVGLLGIAGLQNEAVRFNHSAFLESKAQFLANEIIERIRYNDQAVYAAGSSGDCEGANAGCDAADLAAYDVGVWEQRVSNMLPGGEADITRTPVNANVFDYTITITYDDRRFTGSTEADDVRDYIVKVRI